MKRPIAFVVLAFLLVLPVTASAVTVKLGTVAPEGSPWHDALLEIADTWKKISNGKVKVRIYPGGVAGDEPDLLRKIRIGQLHAAALTKPGLFALAPDIDAIGFPLALRSNEELYHLMETHGPVIEKQLEEKGFKVLNWSSAGWVYFFSRHPVVMPEDLRRQKLFFWGSDTEYIELLKQAGFQPVPLAINDLLPSLQTGLVDAFAAPPVAALSFQWFGLTPNMADLKWQPLPGATIISLKTWNRIPADLRPQLEEASREVGVKFLTRIAELNAEALTVMQEHGLKVNEVSGEAAAAWRDALRNKGGDAFIDTRYSREFYDDVQRELKKYRAGETP